MLIISSSLTPFLYPAWALRADVKLVRSLPRLALRSLSCSASRKSTEAAHFQEDPQARLDPSPDDYGRKAFADKCVLKLFAGSGGNGCASFLRLKYGSGPEGPPNGGDGGSGGNIYIQAVQRETSLYKVARQRAVRAGRGRNGSGKSKGGQRGKDILLQVPVGTVVRELTRYDPVAVEEENRSLNMEPIEGDQRRKWRRDKWIMYPAAMPPHFATADFPALPRPRRSNLTALQPPAPIRLDLSKPMEEPQLLAAGAMGGLGNPHFATKSITRPTFATKGDHGMVLEVELELKLLADMGFVGFPNAGKSTLLRAVSRSQARVGDWAFTTLQPNIGTVVLDDNKGRDKIMLFDQKGNRRSTFTIADIPGIVPEAHLDRGLGLDFLRHIERAQVLAFVVDLSNGNAVETLELLWGELAEFEKLQTQAEAPGGLLIESLDSFASTLSAEGESHSRANAGELLPSSSSSLPRQPKVDSLPALSTRPWFVIATKADIESTQGNFAELEGYVRAINTGEIEHPAGLGATWRGELRVIPVSAKLGQGVEAVQTHSAMLLNQVVSAG